MECSLAAQFRELLGLSIQLGNDNLKSEWEKEKRATLQGLIWARKVKAQLPPVDLNRAAKTRADQSNIPVQWQLSQRQLAGIYAIYLKNYVFGFVLWGNGSTCREHGNPVKCCALNPRSQKPQPGIEIICNTLLVQSWRAINIAASQRAKWRQKLATRKQQTWLCMHDPRGVTHTQTHRYTLACAHVYVTVLDSPGNSAWRRSSP